LVCVLHIRALVQVPGLKGDQFKRLVTLTDKQGKIDTNLALQRPKALQFVREIKR